MKSETKIGSASAEGRKSSGSGAPDYDVAIIGAGPYGLSAAAHLNAKGLGVRVFGEPMQFWADCMPEGMLLRSPRVASNLSDPEGAFTLDAYQAASGEKPTAPVPLKTFVAYGRWFQHQLGSSLEKTAVASVARENGSFGLTLSTGAVVRSRRVVVAAGIGPFQRIPAVFADLPPAQISHCYQGTKIADFVGKRVAVIGAGQSALESAALLHEAGADVEVIARISGLRYIGAHGWLHNLGPISHMLYSKHDIGPMGISRLVAYPSLVSFIPRPIRDKIRTRAVRPAGARWLPPRVSPIKTSTGRVVRSAKSTGTEVCLRLDDGTERRVDHVLLGTGYQVDFSKYPFLSKKLVEQVQHLDGHPTLGVGFTSSVPGLHFIGAPAARSFGPLLYFVTGNQFAGEALTSFIHKHRLNVQ